MPRTHQLPDDSVRCTWAVGSAPVLTNESADTAVRRHAVRVERPSRLGEALRAALAVPGPAVVEVMTVRYEPAVPPKISVAQAKGLTVRATLSVLSGRGDEVLDVDVARTKLRELRLAV